MQLDFDRLQIVFWDFDGVIKDSVRVKTDAFYSLFQPYGEDVAANVRAHHLDHGGMSRFDKIPLYLHWAGLQTTPELVSEFCGRFASAVEDAVVASDWVPGVRQVLLTQCEKSKFVLVTATPQAEIESILDRLGLRQCFIRVFGAPTGKASGIQATLSEFVVSPEHTLMIGDSRQDLIAAQRCRVPFLLRRTVENSSAMSDYNGPFISGFE